MDTVTFCRSCFVALYFIVLKREKHKKETTILMKYVKLGWHIAGVHNGTKSNQKSVKLNQTKSIGVWFDRVR